MHNDQAHDHYTNDIHGVGVRLEGEAEQTVQRGLAELLRLTEGLSFRPLDSERYPLPLTMAIYGSTPPPERVRAEVRAAMEDEAVGGLEAALVLLELLWCNGPDTPEALPDDEGFLNTAFRTKRQNGWIAVLGEGDPAAVASRLNAQGQFVLVSGAGRTTALYPLLNLVARYGFVYGRIPAGDGHAMAHFIEEYAPALLLCLGQLSDLELTLSLAAIKMGLPAVVPADYAFRLGRQVRVESLGDASAEALEGIEDALVAFPNLHRLLDLPQIPPLPETMSPQYAKEDFQAASRWGDTPESFYVLRKGRVEHTGVAVTQERVEGASVPMGVIVTADAEPLDAFDRQYIEARAARALSMLRGVRAKFEGRTLVLDLAEDADLTPRRVGEALIAAIGHEFPKINSLRAAVITERWRLNEMVMDISAEHAARRREIESATEESVLDFATCVGCSPFAPDHVCIVTPERPPQCGRTFEMIQAGSRYSFDDMSNIHHRVLHAGINSFGTVRKGRAIDPLSGEWSGVNGAASQLTGGRTTRIQLHSLDEAPTTGCGCFRLVAFKTDLPRPGIGIMERGYQGQAPDGRTWRDLHYALAGKQTPGIAGASPGYLRSRKFLAAHGGWRSVVWVSPQIAEVMGEELPEGVEVGAGQPKVARK